MTVAETLSPEAIESLYAFAHGYYQNGKYEEATRFFRFLTAIDTNTRKHWMGLAASFQLQKEFAKALQAYGYAGLLNSDDPLAPFHAAECMFSLGEKERALETLQVAENLARNHPKQYENLLIRIDLIKNPVRKNHG